MGLSGWEDCISGAENDKYMVSEKKKHLDNPHNIIVESRAS